ncbi:MAG: thioredoxin domain-containing protein, partial [Chitinophagales bacterium]
MSTNKLIHETSPYLLQHANNPVHWYAWGEEAMERARNEDKPVLVSIGYAACHWCHVMEHESFEDISVASFMNSHFINIKVDREERPDIDNIYMTACQALTGSGGWPLNMFLTPEMKPFTGGTYFPPQSKYGKPAWMDVLIYVAEVFQKQRDAVEQQANALMQHVASANDTIIQLPSAPVASDTFTKEGLITAIGALKRQMDTVNGGFGSAPKFPASMTLRFLWRYNYFQKDAEIADYLTLSLRKMMFGGIYDHVGGGFSRYATDNNWMIPHFEKMLYDNALLISLYAEAYACSGYKWYLHVAEQSVQFVIREMQSPDGGFYASYDADSEGVEGKFYTWSKKEIDTLLADKSELACKIFDVQ